MNKKITIDKIFKELAYFSEKEELFDCIYSAINFYWYENLEYMDFNDSEPFFLEKSRLGVGYFKIIGLSETGFKTDVINTYRKATDEEKEFVKFAEEVEEILLKQDIKIQKNKVTIINIIESSFETEDGGHQLLIEYQVGERYGSFYTYEEVFPKYYFQHSKTRNFAKEVLEFLCNHIEDLHQQLVNKLDYSILEQPTKKLFETLYTSLEQEILFIDDYDTYISPSVIEMIESDIEKYNHTTSIEIGDTDITVFGGFITDFFYDENLKNKSRIVYQEKILFDNNIH